MDWIAYQHEFSGAGNPERIIVTQVTSKDWQKLFSFIGKTQATVIFFIDYVESVLPQQIESIFQDDTHQYLLSLVLDDVSLNCHFDRQEDIVFDFNPAQITNEARAILLFRVMSTFGRRLNKVVELSAINQEAEPIFRYEPGQGLSYLPLDKKLAPYD